MRTALLTALLLLLPSAPAMAIGAGKGTGRHRVEVINQTGLMVHVFVLENDESGTLLSTQHWTLQPGKNKTFNVSGDVPLTVWASAGGSTTSREFSQEVTRVTITLDAQGKVQLSSPADDPLAAASLSRESLLAALCSSGLMGLALVGLLINRHE